MSRRTAVLVTRPAGADDPLVGRLVESGYRALAVPTVTTEPAPPGGPLDDAAARLDEYDWVVLTSAVGVRALLGARERVGGGTPAAVTHPRWAAVGAATARALEEAGIHVDVVPEQSRGAALSDALLAAGLAAGDGVLLARADAAEGDLPAALGLAGARVDDVVAYHTVEGPPESLQALAAALDDSGLAAAVVASGSAARGLLRLAESAGSRAILDRLAFVSIGPSTSTVVRELGFEVAAQADAPSPQALADAVARAVPLGLGEPNDHRLETHR